MPRPASNPTHLTSRPDLLRLRMEYPSRGKVGNGPGTFEDSSANAAALSTGIGQSVSEQGIRAKQGIEFSP